LMRLASFNISRLCLRVIPSDIATAQTARHLSSFSSNRDGDCSRFLYQNILHYRTTRAHSQVA
jgi:hypothetical protein